MTTRFTFAPKMTVADLKGLLKDWPEFNENGEPTIVHVWDDGTYRHV